MKNFEIAKLFNEVADVLEMQEVQWKPRAYRNAANTIEALDEDIFKVYREGRLKEIHGVGDAIAKKIEEYLKTGKVKAFEKIFKSIPKHITELMSVPGIGPRKARILFEKLGICDIKQLKKAIKEHKIEALKGMGEKTAADFEAGIDLVKRSKGKLLLGEALPTAEYIVDRLRSLKEIKQINYAGSLRRMKETIRDIDILVSSSDPKKVMKYFTTMRGVQKIIAKGSTKSAVLLDNGLQVDIRVVEANSFGAALQYFTGSKDHNVALRRIAIKKGYKLSEYGLFKGKNIIAGKTEKEVYSKLGLPYIEPELRENTGELQEKLPKLIGYDDIKGDLHVHSNYSDGSNTIKQLADAAKKLGYEYIGMSDHSPAVKLVHGPDAKELEKKSKEIDKIKGIKVFKGTEVDILKDGKLDYPKKVLDKLDIVIGSIHSGFKNDIKTMTQRIVTAIESGLIHVFGHPTGRWLGQRNPYEVDLEKVFQAAKDNDVIMEVNASPVRLDLDDSNINTAIKEFKLKLMINTDAHSVGTMNNMLYGIATARRGWAEKKDVVNTLSLKKFEKLLR